MNVMRWIIPIVLQGMCALGLGETPASNEELSGRLRRLYEACRTRELQTGEFPQEVRNLEGLLSPALRNKLPPVAFANLKTEENRLKLSSPLGARTPCMRLNLGEGRWLNVAYSGAIYQSGLFWESEFVHLLPLPFMDPKLLKLDCRAIPKRAAARSARCGAAQIDLVPQGNAIPTKPWFFGPLEETEEPFGDLLAQGIYEHEGTLFDVRGALQVEGLVFPLKKGKRNVRSYPDEITGIRVQQGGRRIHLLAGTVFEAKKGEPVATLIFRGSSGKVVERRLEYGVDVAAAGFDEPGCAPRIYPKPGQSAGLYSLHVISLDNPLGGEVIESMDFQSSKTTSHPFLVAMTMEP